MDIVIRGAGITGCSLARLFKDSGHNVAVYEKDAAIGGLCKTGFTAEEGILFDRHGCHIFRTNSEAVYNFIDSYFKLNNKSHYVGTYVNGRIFDWPISCDNMDYFSTIFGSVAMHWENVYNDPTTFEHVSINTFGPILYKLFVENYTRNMWHREPSELDKSVAAKVLKINGNDKRYFKTKHQGWPEGGYSAALRRMTKDIDICYGSPCMLPCCSSALTIHTGPIDELFNYKYGELEYVGMDFKFGVVDKLDPVELYRYPVINYPNCEFGYIRQTAYRGLTGQLAQCEVVGYEYPNKKAKTHPVRCKKSKDQLFQYLKLAAYDYPTLIPAGRLGLFRYMSMDDAIEMAIRIADRASIWHKVSPQIKLQDLCHWAKLDINEYVYA